MERIQYISGKKLRGYEGNRLNHIAHEDLEKKTEIFDN